MPTTVRQLFKQFQLILDGQVKWGQEIKSKRCGIYVVALTDDIDKLVFKDKPDFDDAAIKQWIEVVKSGGKQILIDNNIADIKSIKRRLGQFWLPDETIIYIGKAGPNKKRHLKKRVHEYYETKLGCNKKHAGGHWINTLKNMSALTVFYSEYSEQDIKDMEANMISFFTERVSEKTKQILYDKMNCFPFANKEITERKKHGLNNQTIDCDKQWRKL